MRWRKSDPSSPRFMAILVMTSCGAVPGAAPAAEEPPELPAVSAAMREHIERALAAARGRIEGPHGAAAMLKINPHTLRARMRKLGVDWGRFRSTLGNGAVY